MTHQKHELFALHQLRMCAVSAAISPAFAALHLDAASRLLQQEQAATRNSSADHLSEMYGATPTVNQDDQRTLWDAVVPELPTDADVDVDVPAGWQSHITTKDGHGETWTWNVSHSSVPADKASATVDTWCNTVRPLRTGAMHVPDTNFDLLALIGGCCCCAAQAVCACRTWVEEYR